MYTAVEPLLWLRCFEPAANLRECSFDIAGVYDPMIPDAEIITIINEVFDNLGWAGTYTIKLNSRKILDGLFEVCGVPAEKIRPISSAVDKLDKSPWYAFNNNGSKVAR